MKQHQAALTIETHGCSLHSITDSVQKVVRASGVRTGVCVVFIQHTSASLVIQENADPAVLRDLQRWMEELAPEQRDWEHTDEGPDDMPSHARSAITRASETMVVRDAALALGTWQGLYVWEHRRAAHQRTVLVHVMGE